MRVGVIQSNFLPWRGYFDLIDDVDRFVFYDDVQFTKNDWRNRNRIKTRAGTQWITVPVRHVSSNQLINQTAIDDNQPWRRKLLRTIAQSYGATPHFDHYYPALAAIVEARHPSLAALNHALCAWIMRELAIVTPVFHSCDFDLGSGRHERLVSLLEQNGAKTYLSGPSARSYLDEAELGRRGIALEYKTYDYAPYPQAWGDFVGDVSIVDLLFNTGPAARAHLKSRTPVQATRPVHAS